MTDYPLRPVPPSPYRRDAKGRLCWRDAGTGRWWLVYVAFHSGGMLRKMGERQRWPPPSHRVWRSEGEARVYELREGDDRGGQPGEAEMARQFAAAALYTPKPDRGSATQRPRADGTI